MTVSVEVWGLGGQGIDDCESRGLGTRGHIDDCECRGLGTRG